jgi:hypothetical protein
MFHIDTVTSLIIAKDFSSEITVRLEPPVNVSCRAASLYHDQLTALLNIVRDDCVAAVLRGTLFVFSSHCVIGWLPRGVLVTTHRWLRSLRRTGRDVQCTTHFYFLYLFIVSLGGPDFSTSYVVLYGRGRGPSPASRGRCPIRGGVQTYRCSYGKFPARQSRKR